MHPTLEHGCVLVTGAGGHIGQQLCECLRASPIKHLGTDLDVDQSGDFLSCDLTAKDQVARLFQYRRISAIVHLGGMLPGAFSADPLRGAHVNLAATLELIRQAVAAKVTRFVFASSMSVYGSSCTLRPVNENDPAAPDDLYGAAKRAIELMGEALALTGAIEFVSLRIARVLGPGIKKTSSPWRSQIFDAPAGSSSIRIPYAPSAVLSLVHVDEVARMLVILATAPKLSATIYNTPVELWEAWRLKEVIERVRRVPVELAMNPTHGGPICDGSQFARDFAFQLCGLEDHLQR